VLDLAGHDAVEPALFVCEGLLVYLERDTCHRLLSGLAARAAAGSMLAVSIATHADGLDSAAVVTTANLRRRTSHAEPWLTILPASEHLELIELAGWRISRIERSPVAAEDVTDGRRSLLVAADAGTQSA
jgi:O-methyltransferase involved in polyketide biosynthesis